MQNYELLFILPGTLSETEVVPAVEKIKGTVARNNGLDLVVETMDKRRLAYPIKQIRYGYFYLVFFQADSASMGQMAKELKLIPEVLRVLIRRHDPKKQPIGRIDFGTTFASTDSPVETRVEQAPHEGYGVSTRKLSEVSVRTEPAFAAPKAEPSPSIHFEKADKKMSLDEIDKKLDEILDIDFKSV